MKTKATLPTLSVLVPTRNRPTELNSLLKMIDECKGIELEFIVSDNSDVAVGIESQNANCRIVRPEKVLNMTDHWNFILDKSTGKYICFVGDDDAFIPSELSLLAKNLEEVESDIVWHPQASYQWPRGKNSGNFYQEIRIKPNRDDIEKLKSNVLRLKYGEMPLPYNSALVHRRVMEKFKSNHPGERFISSRVPDQNSGAKILFLSNTQYEYARTVFVSGASPTSNGGLTVWGPDHPRAQEFTDLELNPPPSWFPNIKLPNGFIWNYEAVNESLIQLGISHEVSDRRVCFRSIIDSRNPIQQLRVSRVMWPELSLTPLFALLVAMCLQILERTGVRAALRYFSIIYRVATKKSLLRSIKGGSKMSSTKSMVDFLQANQIVDSRKRIILLR